MKEKKLLLTGFILILAFTLWTVLIQNVDVHPIGQNNTDVGFSTLNSWFHNLTGVNMTIYYITDWLGLIPVFCCMIFGVIGFIQLVRRKSLLKVDIDILLLGIYYIIVILGYLIFEMIPINYRPVPIDGIMEASYPSSTTLLTLSVMPTVSFQAARRIRNCLYQKYNCRIHSFVFTVYDNRAYRFRSSLVDGYYRFNPSKCRTVSDLQAMRFTTGKKEML